jgi:hypothetical protein
MTKYEIGFDMSAVYPYTNFASSTTMSCSARRASLTGTTQLQIRVRMGTWCCLCSSLFTLVKLETTNFTPTTSFTDPRDVRYNHKMAPAIWKDKWRKGSQEMRKLYLCPFYSLFECSFGLNLCFGGDAYTHVLQGADAWLCLGSVDAICTTLGIYHVVRNKLMTSWWGWQWFVLIRKHTVEVVKDSTVFPVFQRYCKVWLALPLNSTHVFVFRFMVLEVSANNYFLASHTVMMKSFWWLIMQKMALPEFSESSTVRHIQTMNLYYHSS